MKKAESAPRPRVLFVVNDSRFFVTHRLPLALGIRDAGYDVHVAASPESGVSAILAAGLPFHPLRLAKQGMNPLADARTVFELVGLYRRLKPALVHQVTIKPVMYGTVAARIAGVPAVVNAIAGLGILFSGGQGIARVRRAGIRNVYARTVRHRNMRLIFQNASDLNDFVAMGLVQPGHAVIIPGSGADLSSLRPTAEVAGTPLVVLVARLLRQKGVVEFAEAAARLKAEGINARFALVGDPADNRAAVPRRLLQQWSDDGAIELWGWRDDMPDVLRQAAIVCLPSYYPEGVPKALIDAAAAGRPIVTTTMPGCRETVVDGVNGYQVPPRDVDALVAALRRLLQDADLRQKFGAASRRLAEERFSIDAVIHATLELYSNLLPEKSVVQPRSDSAYAY